MHILIKWSYENLGIIWELGSSLGCEYDGDTKGTHQFFQWITFDEENYQGVSNWCLCHALISGVIYLVKVISRERPCLYLDQKMSEKCKVPCGHSWLIYLILSWLKSSSWLVVTLWLNDGSLSKMYLSKMISGAQGLSWGQSGVLMIITLLLFNISQDWVLQGKGHIMGRFVRSSKVQGVKGSSKCSLKSSLNDQTVRVS